jgi:hypothetical protein
MRIERAIAAEVLERIKPLGIEAALSAMKKLDQAQSDKRRQMENAIEQARFEAARAYRQYDAADPENRLVASDLERRWNESWSPCARSRKDWHSSTCRPNLVSIRPIVSVCLR